MNEVTRLRTQHLDYGEWEDGDEHYDDGGENGNLDQWYRDETGYPDAAGVWAIDYDERARRASAPLKGLQTTTDSFAGPTDFVSAARKAAQAAATAATEHSQINKAYEKLCVSIVSQERRDDHLGLFTGYCDCCFRLFRR